LWYNERLVSLKRVISNTKNIAQKRILETDLNEREISLLGLFLMAFFMKIQKNGEIQSGGLFEIKEKQSV
jgi:hypothetical protein